MRVADVLLRCGTGRLLARVYRPHETDGPSQLLVLFDGAVDTVDALCRRLCERDGAVVLSVPCQGPAAIEEATAVLGWAADHAAELGADPGRLGVVGAGAGVEVATAVARHARKSGWPVLTGPVLVESEKDGQDAG